MRFHWLPLSAADEAAPALSTPARTPGAAGRPLLGGLLTLRGKTAFLVGVIFALLMLALYYPLRQVLVDNALALETHEISTDVERSRDALATQGDDLLRLAVSYASWDDTYAFVTEGDPAYMEENHAPAVLEAEARDLVYLLDARGEPVASAVAQRMLDLGLSAPELPAPVRALLVEQVAAASSYVGLLSSADGPVLVTAAPILRSDGGGPAAGVLAMGYLLDDVAVERLARRTYLRLELYRPDDPAIPADVRVAAALLAPDDPALVRPLDEATVGGYALLADIEGRPVAVLRILEQRSIYQQGTAGAASLALGLVVAWVLFALVILFLLDRLILQRVARLSGELRRIGADGDLGDRVTVEGGDELAAMSAQVNGMLEHLAHAARAQREASEERLQLQAQVIEAEREAIARVSHELRNPLTPIKGFVDMLLKGYEGPLRPSQREALETVRDNVNRMVGLVNDLLEIGRAESGRLQLDLSVVHLPAAVDGALTLLGGEITRKGLQVERCVAPDLPPVEADGRRIDQILINLISNAVKYTYDGGTVRIGLERAGDGQVVIRVGDTGIGLTPEQQGQLFTPFFRANSPLHTSANGTGLGLRITRSLVELHHGSIAVTSTYGVGSVFAVTLPLAQPPAAEGA